jgi:hypothetical protein
MSEKLDLNYNFFQFKIRKKCAGLEIEEITDSCEIIINTAMRIKLGIKQITINSVDGTEYFEGSVRNAINYFSNSDNSFILTSVYSSSKGRWYQNSLSRPNNFIEVNIPFDFNFNRLPFEWEQTIKDRQLKSRQAVAPNYHKIKYLKYKQKYLELKNTLSNKN